MRLTESRHSTSSRRACSLNPTDKERGEKFREEGRREVGFRCVNRVDTYTVVHTCSCVCACPERFICALCALSVVYVKMYTYILHVSYPKTHVCMMYILIHMNVRVDMRASGGQSCAVHQCMR